MITSDDVINAKHDLVLALDGIAPNQGHDTVVVMQAIDRLIQISLAAHIQNSPLHDITTGK